MKKCNANGTCPVSGENICCKVCDKLQTCPDACEDALDLTKACPEEIDEPEVNELQVFKSKEVTVINAMVDLLEQKKKLEETEKTVRAKLLEAMAAYNVKSFDTDALKVTYIAATSKTTIDTKALKKEKPDIAEQYSKTSPVAASVRIALK